MCPCRPLSCFVNSSSTHADFDVESELSELNEKQANIGQPYSFGSLKPTSVSMFATAGSKKKLEKKRGGRSVLVPVAPPRLPPPVNSSSANNSTAVTPTSVNLFPMKAVASSFDDSTDSATLRTSIDETTLSIDDIEPSDELKRFRRPNLSKLYSLQDEHDAEAFFDDSSNVLDDSCSPLHQIGICLISFLHIFHIASIDFYLHFVLFCSICLPVVSARFVLFVNAHSFVLVCVRSLFYLVFDNAYD